MKTQGWILTIYIFLILIAEWTRSVSAAQFLKSLQNNMCLQRASNSTSGCFLISTSPCPTDRFGSIPDSSQWNIIPSNPASPSDFFIQSTDNKLCLVTDGSNTAQVCACDSGSVSQRLILDNGNLKNGQLCLAAIGNSAGLSTCNTGLQWKAYPVAPDTVNVYIGTSFTQKKIPLSLNNYTSSDLPAEIYSSAFSMEIPPGFQFIIHKNNKNNTVYENDMSQVNPIGDLTSTVEIKLKPGMVIYENAAYFGASQFLPNGNTTTATQDSPMMVGSAMVPAGFRGITWQSSGGNFVVYEPVTNFSVIAENAKVSAASVDISAATCSSECASGGYCSGNNQCTCKPGFTGTQCDQCLPGFYGPMCQGCPSSCNNSTNHFLCDDGISGTGTCKSQCAPGFAGSNCTTCAPGYFGSDCKPCNCGNGTCDNKGTCICNAGWTSNNCTVTMPGYYINSDGNARACSPGCSVCASPDGTCTQCSSDLLKQSTDNPQNCVPINPTTQCDSTCQTCYGPDATNCLTCASPRYLLAGSCVQIQLDNSGTCVVPSGNGVYFVDTQQGLCEPCPKNCLSCQFPSFTPASPPTDMKCSKCNPGTFLNDGKCVNVCPPGKYVDPTNNMTCSACNQNCASCTGPSETQCLSCSDNTHFALNGTCSTKKCPSSYATINTTCTPCHPDCGQCSGPSFDQCTKCPSNRPILKDGQCIPACAKGKYADENGTCQPCNSECSSCVGPKSNQCLGCSDMTKVLSGGSCAVCPAGNKLLQSERLCQRIESDNLVGNVEQPDSSKKSMPWWVILLIIIGVVLVLCVCVYCFRRCMIKRRKKKTQEFGDKIDNNMVSKHLAELAGVSVSQPEPSYRALSKSALKPREYDEMGEAPPVYEPEDAKNWEDIKLWEELKRKSSRIGRKKKNDWDGFELVSNEGGAVPNRSSNGPNHWGKNWI